jgi:SnoaL-like domain
VTSFPLAELRTAFENFNAVSANCALTADYNPFADLFTEDCTYVEHVFGEMHGREAVRQWIVPLMKKYPNDQMVRYTHDWVLYDEANGRVVFSIRTHMADPGDGSDHTTTNWTRLDYAGDGLFSREEDIYNPMNFGKLLKDWQRAKDAVAAAAVS